MAVVVKTCRLRSRENTHLALCVIVSVQFYNFRFYGAPRRCWVIRITHILISGPDRSILIILAPYV